MGTLQGMTITPASLNLPIIQGATFDEALERSFFPYETELSCGQLVRKDTGAPVNEADRVDEDYTGCTAELQLRHPVTKALIATLNTVNDGIVLSGKVMRLFISHTDTADFEYGETAPAWTYCIGHVEVTRPDGTRERQYSITSPLDPEETV